MVRTAERGASGGSQRAGRTIAATLVAGGRHCALTISVNILAFSAWAGPNLQAAFYSLLGDYFPRPAERTRAMYVWDLSNPIATLVSFMAAGWLNELFGWRTTFLLVGIPGLVLALLFRVTVREPRTLLGSEGQSRSSLPPMRAVLGVLWHQQSCRHLTIAMILIFTMAQGLGPWYAAFMIRSHGMGTAELGVSMGIVWGLSGLGGLLVGAYNVGR
jgi:predicted MFS family arabinose efflux permease